MFQSSTIFFYRTSKERVFHFPHTHHDRFLVLHCAEAIADKHNRRVYEESDEDAGCRDFHIWALVLVHVPCSTNAQKFSGVARSVENQDDQIHQLENIVFFPFISVFDGIDEFDGNDNVAGKTCSRGAFRTVAIAHFIQSQIVKTVLVILKF